MPARPASTAAATAAPTPHCVATRQAACSTSRRRPPRHTPAHAQLHHPLTETHHTAGLHTQATRRLPTQQSAGHAADSGRPNLKDFPSFSHYHQRFTHTSLQCSKQSTHTSSPTHLTCSDKPGQARPNTVLHATATAESPQARCCGTSPAGPVEPTTYYHAQRRMMRPPPPTGRYLSPCSTSPAGLAAITITQAASYCAPSAHR